MKKALSLILALILCLSLCACGGSEDANLETEEAVPETTEYPYAHLVAETWTDIYDKEATITLKEDGTGVRSGSGITWKVVGDFLYITTVANEYTIEYNLVFKNDIWRIVTKDESRVFVGESNFDAVYNNERNTATIHLHDGSVVEMTGKEVYNLYKENSAVFNELYKGADITFVGTIEKIDSGFVDSSFWVDVDYITFKEGWYLQLLSESYADLILTLKPGDKLKVSTQLVSVYNEKQIAVWGAHENASYSPKTWATTVIEVVTEE